jgi:hypothetical protein
MPHLSKKKTEKTLARMEWMASPPIRLDKAIHPNKATHLNKGVKPLETTNNKTANDQHHQRIPLIRGRETRKVRKGVPQTKNPLKTTPTNPKTNEK